MENIDGPFARIIRHRVSVSSSIPADGIFSLELDSHADSPVVGKNAFVLERTGKKVSVSGFADDLGKPLLLDVVHAAVMFDPPDSSDSYLFVIHNALFVESLDCALINPFMMRLANIQVDECPKFLAPIPSIANHSLFFPDANIRIPLALNGIVSYLPCRMPRGEEVANPTHILHLTPQSDTWNPHDPKYQAQEEAMTDFRGELKVTGPRKFIVSSIQTSSVEPDLFAENLVKSAQSCPSSVYYVKAVKSLDGKDSSLDPMTLARTWNVSVDIARRTIQRTTRLCPRNTTSISLHRRYEANDRMLRYRHLNCNMFADTMFASAKAGKSVRNYTCVQVFATDFGWCTSYNMSFEREIHTAYKRLFKDVGVPRKLIVDGAKAQVEGEARKVCNEVGCEIVELEKYTPASNRAERTIQELKVETRRDMMQSGSPLVFW